MYVVVVAKKGFLCESILCEVLVLNPGLRGSMVETPPEKKGQKT